jgi:integrase
MDAPHVSAPSRSTALEARGWDPADAKILDWERRFRLATRNLQDDAGLQFLQNYLLAPGDWTAVMVLRSSWAALRLLDLWFPTDFDQILTIAQKVPIPLVVGGSANPFRSVAEHPVLALLSQQHPATDKGGLQVAKALLLAGMFQGSLLATAGAVQECADGLRKSLALASWEDLVPWSELTFGQSFTETLQATAKLLEDGHVKAQAAGNSAQQTFIREFTALVEGLRIGVARIPARQQLSSAVDGGDDDEGRPQLSVLFVAPEGHAEAEISGTGQRPPTAESTAGEAQESDPAAPANGNGPVLGGESEEHAKFRAMQTGFRAAISNQYLNVDLDQLLQHELKALVRELNAALGGTTAIERRAAALLLTSLFTGETLASILASRIEPTVRPGFARSGRWIRVVRPEPQARIPGREQRAFLARHGDRFELSLPTPLVDYFGEALKHTMPGTVLAHGLSASAETMIHQAHEWLAEFRKRHPRVLLGKIGRWLPTALYAQTHDQVAVHLITATESDPPCPAAYYRAPRAVDLQRIHAELVRRHWPGAITRPAKPSVRVGSWWFPRQGALEQLYAAAHAGLTARTQDLNLPPWQRHRAHQVLSVLNILLSTASRAVNDPAESLTQFDLEHAWGVLDDKSGGPARGHRLIPLAQVAAEQIRHQTEYLPRLSASLAQTHPASAAAIKGIVTAPERRLAPLFFLLDEDYQLRSLTPTDLALELGEFWPLPLNFARHWLSTALFEGAVPDEAINAFLGHVLLGTQNLSALALRTGGELFATARPVLNQILNAAGLKVAQASALVPSVVATGQGGMTTERMSPLFEFGSARRARQRALDETALEAIVDKFLETRSDPRPLKALGRKDIQSLFEKLNGLTPNAQSFRAIRLRQILRARLAVVAKKHLKDWRLPSVEMGLADFQIIVEPDALLACPRVEKFRSAIDADLRLCALAPPQDEKPAASGLTATLAMALVAECLVLDLAVVRAWAAKPSADIVEVRTAESGQRQGVRSIRLAIQGVGSRLYPISAGLSDRLLSVLSELVAADAKQIDREITRFARRHELEWLQGGLKEVIRTVRSAASLQLNGMSVGFAAGLHGSVSLPAGALERLVQGAVSPDTHELIVLSLKSNVASLQLDPSVPRPEIKHTAIAQGLEGVPLFMGMVGGCFTGASAFSVTKDNKMAYGSSRVDYLKALLDERFEAFQETTPTPSICGHLLGWLHALCADGRMKGGYYSYVTLTTYWSNLAFRLIEQVETADISKMDPIEIEEIYQDLIECAETDRLDHIYNALRVFHAYLMRCHAVPGIDWQTLASMADSGPSRVDANLVTEAEYLDALRMLRADKHVSPRQRGLQAAVLILCFRGGLRIAEAFGIRRKDIQCVGGVWIVRVAKNLYRGLKSTSSLRVVPFLEVLDPLEQTTLNAWVRHADEYLDGRDTTALFTRGTNTRELTPRSRVAARLRAALHQATGDPSVRVHHCRHGLPNRLIAAATACQLRGSGHLRSLVRQWPEAAAILSVLTQETSVSRRLIWAVANVMGHSVATLLRSYFHLGSELLSREVRARWWRAAEPECESKAGTQNTALRVLNWKARPDQTVELPDEPLAELEPVLIDRTIDMLRRCGRADGIGDALMIHEGQVQAIALTASKLVEQARGAHTERPEWWFATSEVEYAPSQVDQVHRALRVLATQELAPLLPAVAQAALNIDESQYLLMVHSQAEFKQFAPILRALVDEPTNVELVLPAATVPRPNRRSPETKEPSAPPPKRGRPTKGAQALALALGDAAWAPWRVLAAEHGCSVAVRSHLAGAKDLGRNRKERQLRCGLRIRMNGKDRVRDAKAACRIVTVAAVWHRLRDQAQKDACATTTASA